MYEKEWGDFVSFCKKEYEADAKTSGHLAALGVGTKTAAYMSAVSALAMSASMKELGEKDDSRAALESAIKLLVLIQAGLAADSGDLATMPGMWGGTRKVPASMIETVARLADALARCSGGDDTDRISAEILADLCHEAQIDIPIALGQMARDLQNERMIESMMIIQNESRLLKPGLVSVPCAMDWVCTTGSRSRELTRQGATPPSSTWCRCPPITHTWSGASSSRRGGRGRPGIHGESG